MPTAGESPEEWIGQRVLVEIIGGIGYQAVVRLDGINDWGIVVTGKAAEPSARVLPVEPCHGCAARAPRRRASGLCDPWSARMSTINVPLL